MKLILLLIVTSSLSFAQDYIKVKVVYRRNSVDCCCQNHTVEDCKSNCCKTEIALPYRILTECGGVILLDLKHIHIKTFTEYFVFQNEILIFFHSDSKMSFISLKYQFINPNNLIKPPIVA